MSVAVDADGKNEDAASPMEAQVNSTNEENQSTGTKETEDTTTIPTIQRRESKPGFWHGATREDCQNAEESLVHAFVDLKKYHFESKDIFLPNFDPRPNRIIEKERNQSLSSWSLANLFSWKGNDDKKTTATTTTTTVSNATTTNGINSKFESKDDTGIVSSAMNNSSNDNNNSNITESKNENTENDSILQTKSKSMYVMSNNSTNENKEEKKNSCEENYNIGNKQFRKPEFIHTLSFSHRDVINAAEEKTEVLLSAQSNDENKETKENSSMPAPIVLAHGYGCAGGVFIPSVEIIYNELLKYNSIRNKSRRIHIIDWLGCGLSSRAKFLCDNDIESEKFFIESLEEWRRNMGIKRMILVGHSLGGYMSAVYALKYPQFIEHLILLSPVGVPTKPNDYGDLSKYTWKTRLLLSTFRNLWDKGYTPHDVIRFIGPKGKSFVEGAVNRRLYRLNDTLHGQKLKPLLAEYLFQMTHGGGSGEYALNKILMPGAFAYNPLYSRLPKLGIYQSKVNNNIYNMSDNITEKKESKETKTDNHLTVNNNENKNNNSNDNTSGSDTDIGDVDADLETALSALDGQISGSDNSDNSDIIDVSKINETMKIDFIYGESDWMDDHCAKELKKNKQLKCNVYKIKDAGHQLLLENTDLFATKLASIIANGEI